MIVDLCFICTHTATHNMCTVHLINNGVTVSGNSATVEFDSTGPSNAFLCSLDFAALIPCEYVGGGGGGGGGGGSHI